MAKGLAFGVALAAVLVAAPGRASGQEAPVVPNERPMRFVLTAGAEVVGTRVGEDAETFTVQTASGLVRVRKIDIAFMDFRTGGTTPAPPPVVAPGPAPPVVAPAPVLTPAPPLPPAPPPEPRRRKALLRAGITGLAASYLVTAGIGAIASIWDSDANWALLPVAGPMVYYQVGDLDEGVFGLLLLSTVLQGASLIALIAGIVVYSRSAEPVVASTPPRFALTPVLSDGARGLSLSLRL